MAASYADKAILTTDSTFGTRVLESLVAYCGVVGSEGWAVPFHRERARYAAQILSNPANFKTQVVDIVADDTSVIADATQNGTVVLTVGNVAAQAALVTDVHIDNSVASTFNDFIVEPGA